MKAPLSAIRFFAYLFVGLTLANVSTEAQNTGVDWKFFGGAPYEGGELCFYEELSVAHNADHLRVWTKCLKESEVTAFHLNHEMTERAATKIAHYYVPPINKMIDIDVSQATTITIYEEIATNGDLNPPIEIYYEIDCSEGRIRTLSASMTIDGQAGSLNKIGEWSYIKPEGNAAALRKILCDTK